ncbi:hypothetical protein BpHYR1_014623 [Brachionus plicatilis]|uniref:Uncharacterized protein n=1 Tax=Brachionus plicatilis TaxID=10195 RepID=A0A3M7T7A3_BRAPC|nr:hypothetical protein BpHYR1_014623 [Brachionus plicatilis]
MEDLKIILPCGFIAKYKDIFCSKDNFECPECKTHTTSQEECLHLPRNKLIINQTILNSKKNKFKDCLKKLELYKNDPKFYIDESNTKIKNNIYLRREEIKIMLNKKIDEYFENLLKMIDDERDSNFVVVFEKLKQISSLERETSNFKIQKDMDVYSKIKLIKKYKSKIDSGIHFVENTIEKFTEANLKLMESNEHVDITKLFGELFLGPETNIISYGSEQDIDDDSRSEGTFNL